MYLMSIFYHHRIAVCHWHKMTGKFLGHVAFCMDVLGSSKWSCWIMQQIPYLSLVLAWAFGFGALVDLQTWASQVAWETQMLLFFLGWLCVISTVRLYFFHNVVNVVIWSFINECSNLFIGSTSTFGAFSMDVAWSFALEFQPVKHVHYFTDGLTRWQNQISH